jgi:hypothetical protein
MHSPNDPDPTGPDRRIEQLADREPAEGAGAIIAVVAIAALLIVGMLYIMRPVAEPPSSVTSQTETVPTPVSKPMPDTPQ